MARGDEPAGERADAAGGGHPVAAADGPPTLDPAQTVLHRAADGTLRLEAVDRCHLRVACYRAFPLSARREWIVFFDGGGGHIGVLEDLAALDAASAAACSEELELRYVVPAASEVLSIREESGESEWNPAQIWDLLTDRGPLRLHLPNLADHVRPVGEGRLLLTDRDQRRCLLLPARLDARSRTLVSRYLWIDGLQEG